MLKEKYEVRVATSGMQALTLIGKKKTDLIFLDYEMPICDGKMTLEMIRELDESKDIPVVFLTGVSDKEHIAAVLDLKPEGYLLKPANSDVIYKTIEKVFGEINNDI
ncbi:MAG: response regulator [Lachnospiraceae bacterium]|nr:response regulator [Lachnospiraceae bacterium]